MQKIKITPLSQDSILRMQTLRGIAELADNSFDFNNISGQANELTNRSFKDQLSFIKEEVQELEEALEADDKIEELDALVDICVVVFGYMQKLQNRTGCDIFKACIEVGSNNLSKFPTSEEVAVKSVQAYSQKGLMTEYNYNKEYDCFVVRDSLTGKVKKPYDYKPVDLSGCFPTIQ